VAPVLWIYRFSSQPPKVTAIRVMAFIVVAGIPRLIVLMPAVGEMGRKSVPRKQAQSAWD